MPARTKSRPQPVTPPPAPRQEIHPREPWPVRVGSVVRAFSPRIEYATSLLEDRGPIVYHLPPWQRGQVWSSEQQVAFCEALWSGVPTAPLLIWLRGYGADRRQVVLDGQQRLSAMNARLLRADETFNAPSAAHLDLETGRWQVGPAEGHPPITMYELADLRWAIDKDITDRTSQLVAAAHMRRAPMVVYEIQPEIGVDDAIAIFRAWNRPGTPIPPDEVEELIRTADQSWG